METAFLPRPAVFSVASLVLLQGWFCPSCLVFPWFSLGKLKCQIYLVNKMSMSLYDFKKNSKQICQSNTNIFLRRKSFYQQEFFYSYKKHFQKCSLWPHAQNQPAAMYLGLLIPLHIITTPWHSSLSGHEAPNLKVSVTNGCIHSPQLSGKHMEPFLPPPLGLYHHVHQQLGQSCKASTTVW